MSVQSQQAQANQKVWEAWQAFWSSKLGQEVMAVETASLRPLLEELRGYHLLMIGSCPAGELLESSSIRHRMEWRPTTALADQPSCLVADPAALPLPDDSMDLVLLQHSLELFARPHALLKEAARVTLAKGELVILGFNPVSLWGLARRLPSFLQPQPLRQLKSADLIGQTKLADWLEFLDMQKESEQQLFHRPPCNRLSVQTRLRTWDLSLDQKNWPLAGIYLLRVTKRIGHPMKPQPAWKKRGWLPVQPVSSPTRNSLKNR